MLCVHEDDNRKIHVAEAMNAAEVSVRVGRRLRIRFQGEEGGKEEGRRVEGDDEACMDVVVIRAVRNRRGGVWRQNGGGGRMNGACDATVSWERYESGRCRRRRSG